MILVRVTVEAADETTRAPLVALLIETMAASRAEAGCVEYRFTADLAAPLSFHVVELWRDEASVVGHLSGEGFVNFAAALPTLGRVVQSNWMSGDLAPYTRPRPVARS